MKILNILLTILFFGFINVQAQIALAVEKNDNGSTIKYAIGTGSSINEALQNAYKTLKDSSDNGFIVKMKSEKETGHELNKGFYALIRCSRKSGGKFLLTYGLGASQTSKEEAVKRALIHLKEFDWGFDNKYGYAIVKDGKIEDLFPAEE